MFFDGFRLTVPGGGIRLRHGGAGPPLLLLQRATSASGKEVLRRE